MTVSRTTIVDFPVVRTLKVLRNRRRTPETIRIYGTMPLPVRIARKSEAVGFEIRMMDDDARYEGLRGILVDDVPHVDVRENLRAQLPFEPPRFPEDIDGDDPNVGSRYAGIGEEDWCDPSSFGAFSVEAELPGWIHHRVELPLYRAISPDPLAEAVGSAADDVDVSRMEILSDDRERAEASASRTAASLVFGETGLFSSLIEPVVSRRLVRIGREEGAMARGLLMGLHVDAWRTRSSLDCLLLGMGVAAAGQQDRPVGVPELRGAWMFSDAETEIQRVRDVLDRHDHLSLGPCRSSADEFDVLVELCWNRMLTADEVARAADLVRAMADGAGVEENSGTGVWTVSAKYLSAMAEYRRVNPGCFDRTGGRT